MNRRLMNLTGIGLVLLGGLAFFNATILDWIGFGLWRFWPLAITAVGAGLIAAPFLSGQPRRLSPLFIPGLPILMISTLLLWGSVFNWWGIWEHAWPMVPLAFALGFALTAAFMRTVWFLIPAIIIGGTAVVLQFTALTGWWEAWAILWPVPLLSIGLALLATGQIEKSSGLTTAGTILAGIAGAGFALMAVIMSGVMGVFGAVLLVSAGLFLVMHSLVRERPLQIKEKDLVEKLPETVK